MKSFLVFGLLLLCFFFCSPAPAAAVVPLGSTLNPSGNTANTSSWPSPGNIFSFGFLPSPIQPSRFTAAIVYSGGLPIWTVGSVLDSSASISFDTSGDLRVINGSGAIIWSSNTSGKGVTTLSVQDSGNLVLYNRSNSVIWQSFDHPVDTLVEGQNLSLGQSLNSSVYSFSLVNNGNLSLVWRNYISYYNEGLNSSFTSNRTLISPKLTMQSDGIVALLDESLPSSATVAFSSNYGESGDMLRFVRLDSDGNLRAYSSLRNSGTATEQWAAVADQCLVFGYCGNLGVCSYNVTSPVCGCPSENFVFVDQNDPRQGCRRTEEIQNCPGNSTMLVLDNTQFLTYPPEISTEQFFVGSTACRLNCLAGGSCFASTSLADGSGLCYLKVSNFVSGYKSAALPSTSFVKVCAPASPNPVESAIPSSGKKQSKLSAGVVAIVIIGTIAGLMLLEFGLWWLFCRNNPKYGAASAKYSLLEYASGAPVQFSYKELQRATKGFKEKLGAGGFGAVYRGVLANRTVVAVKQLEGIEQGEKQFRMEVATISSTHHLNLVRLIGFCSEGRHRLLVYEFLKNGSLDNFLFPDESSAKLSWPTRFSIAVGTARGITYLHEECRDCIVHCDIKPENILVDDNFNAKVSDFGLAKLINPKDHRQRTLTTVRGTRGYLAPEWLANLPITSKSDVYSYGMVLLEIISGRRNFDVSEDTGRKKFSVWAYEQFDQGDITSIVDKRLAVQDVDMAQLERVAQVSFWCIQEQPSQRPSMGRVVQMLEGIMEIERPPAPRATDAAVSITSSDQTSAIVASGPAPSSAASSQFMPGAASFSGRPVAGTASSLLTANHSPSYNSV